MNKAEYKAGEVVREGDEIIFYSRFYDKRFTGKVDKIFGHLCNVVTEDGLKMLIEVRDILKVTGWSLLEGRKRLDGSVDPSTLWWIRS